MTNSTIKIGFLLPEWLQLYETYIRTKISNICSMMILTYKTVWSMSATQLDFFILSFIGSQYVKTEMKYLRQKIFWSDFDILSGKVFSIYFRSTSIEYICFLVNESYSIQNNSIRISFISFICNVYIILESV